MARHLFALVFTCAFLFAGGGPAQAGELFGAAEEKFSDTRVFYKWTDVLSRFDAQRGIPAPWERDERRLQALPLNKMVENVNNTINSYTYISNSREKPNRRWQTPLEFFRQGGGSCQDFAIAKYLWLEHLGVPEDKLRIAIVYDKQRQLPHALSLVYTDSGILVLDNQDRRVESSKAVTRYKPIYSINRHAWWKNLDRGVVVNPAGEVTLRKLMPQRQPIAASNQASFLPTVK